MSAGLPPTENPLAGLKKFREASDGCFTRAREARFELGEALWLSPGATSTVELSLRVLFRRPWGSVYAALSDGPVDRDGLLRLLLGPAPAAARLLWA